MRECCRCALIRDGELSVQMDGLLWTLKLPASNLDSTAQVNFTIAIITDF